MVKYYVYVFLFCFGLFWSAITPEDYFTWFLEVFPALFGFIILLLSFRKFKFTTFAYTFILMHCFILFIGGHYTYAKVPAFDWLKELLHQNRNNYDKVGHFAQGFVPAIIIRELFVRKDIVNKKAWLSFIVVCVCLAISACYEFLEWAVASISGQSAEDFLGTQGYVWDTQSDMLLATMGAVVMLIFFRKIHDKQIVLLQSYPNKRRQVL